MSDVSGGEGWWQASDGKWYPPEQHPDAAGAAPDAGTEAGGDTGRETIATGPPGPTAADDTGQDPTGSGGDTPDGAAAAPPPGQPPTEPSGAPPPPGSSPPPGQPAAGGGGGRGRGKILGAIVAVVVLAAGAFVVLTQLDDEEASASVVLEPIGSTGDDAFASSVAPEPAGSLADYAEQGAPEDEEDDAEDPDGEAEEEPDPGGPGGYQTADGSVPGIYGGTLNEGACDKDQLTGFLATETEKAEAWASVLEIDPADIGRYVAQLTPVNLGADTRVVNYGFDDGEPVPRDSVLQRGTAVLVDEHGVPRVNCYSGNPLREPTVEDDETFTGEQWSSFERTGVLLVDDAPDQVEAFEMIEISTGQRFTRPAGTSGEADRPATRELTDDGPIEFDTEYPDELNDARTEARYTFDAPDSAILTLTVVNDEASLRRINVELTSEGERFASFRASPGATEERTIMLHHDGGAPFALEFTEGPAAYEFEVGLELQDDAGEGADAGDEFASGVDITAGTEVDGTLGGSDSTDVYLVDVVPGAELVFDASVARDSDRRAGFTIRLGDERLNFERVGPGGDDTFSTLLSDQDSGVIEVAVTEGPNDYAFTLELVEQNDGGQPGDAPGDLAEARTLESVEELDGQVGNRDSSDLYLFETPGPNLAIEVTNEASSDRRVGITVLDSSGSRVTFFRVNPGATESEGFEAEPGEEYRLEVTEGRASYQVSITEAELIG